MIDKREAARRQLECAIRLAASEGDALAVHTLTMAAYGILQALIFRDDRYRREFERRLQVSKSRLWEIAVFLKHADRDPDGVLEAFAPQENDWRIGLCSLMYRTVAAS
jgi:hypothetical protein